jgi:hypothetical protein
MITTSSNDLQHVPQNDLRHADGHSAARPLARPLRGSRGFMVVGLAAVLAIFTTTSAARADVGLGTADGFAILAGQIVTNTGSSTVHGDIGIHPGASGTEPNITGYEPGADQISHTGELYDRDAEGVALKAQEDLGVAYDDAAGRTDPILITRELDTADLTAGVYASNDGGDFLLSAGGTLKLTGDADDVWIFQSASGLTFESDTTVELVGADPCNVFWQVTSSATIGTDAVIVGTIMALTSISLATGATLDGRALARNGSVTLQSNTITMESCIAVAEEEAPVAEEEAPVAEEAAPEPDAVPVETPERVDTGAGGAASRTGPLFLPFVLGAIVVSAAVRLRRDPSRRLNSRA